MDEETYFGPDTDWVRFGIYCALCLGIVLFSGLMAGLTIGYFSIEKMEIALLNKNTGTMEEIRMMESLRGLLSKKHELLVTLLLCNSLAMESLPIFLDQIFPSWAAILFSVVFVLIFGEILPQAICATNPLKFGYRFSCLVKCLKFVLYPIVWPLGKMLDCILGEHNAQFLLTKSELNCLIEEYANVDKHMASPHRHPYDPTQSNGDGLRHDAHAMLIGAIKLQKETAEDAMTPWEEVATLSESLKFDSDTISRIYSEGHSRYPVIGKHKHDVKGYVLTRDILPLVYVEGTEIERNHKLKKNGLKNTKHKTVKNLNTWTPLFVSPETTCFDCINIMQHERKHIAFVTVYPDLLMKCRKEGRSPSEHIDLYMGIVTMEDLFEKLIQEQIYDEADRSPLTKKAATAFAETLFTPDVIMDKFFEQLKKKREGKALGSRLKSNIISQYLSHSQLLVSEDFTNITLREQDDHTM